MVPVNELATYSSQSIVAYDISTRKPSLIAFVSQLVHYTQEHDEGCNQCILARYTCVLAI